MKRDWDVIREVLIEVEALSEQERNTFGFGLGDEHADDDPAKSEPALLLWKAGFIEAIDVGTMAGPAILSPKLTWQRQDLLDTLRSNAVWERVRTTAKEKGIELTFDVVKGIGKVALDYVLKQGTQWRSCIALQAHRAIEALRAGRWRAGGGCSAPARGASC